MMRRSSGFGDLRDWFSENFVLSLAILVTVFAIIVIVLQKPWVHHPPAPCSTYQDLPMNEVPARCIKELQR